MLGRWTASLGYILAAHLDDVPELDPAAKVSVLARVLVLVLAMLSF